MKKSTFTSRKFFGIDLSISLRFLCNLDLEGKLSRKVSKSDRYFHTSFAGIYQNRISHLSICFFTESAGIMTCYTGEIFEYEKGKECLLLRYWPIDDLSEFSQSFSDSKNLLLLDAADNDLETEVRKVIDQMPANIFV